MINPDHKHYWYLVLTKPRQERQALKNLEQQGYQCYLPIIRQEKIVRHKIATVESPCFPRYLFIKLGSSDQDKSWAPIRSTPGVSQLVRFGQKAAKVDQQIIDTLKTGESEKNPISLFQPGQRVQVASGPFAGLYAVFQEVDAEKRIILLLEILSKPVRLAMSTNDLIG